MRRTINAVVAVLRCLTVPCASEQTTDMPRLAGHVTADNPELFAALISKSVAYVKPACRLVESNTTDAFPKLAAAMGALRVRVIAVPAFEARFLEASVIGWACNPEGRCARVAQPLLPTRHA